MIIFSRGAWMAASRHIFLSLSELSWPAHQALPQISRRNSSLCFLPRMAPSTRSSSHEDLPWRPQHIGHAMRLERGWSMILASGQCFGKHLHSWQTSRDRICMQYSPVYIAISNIVVCRSGCLVSNSLRLSIRQT